jgi:ABC-type Fe3+ transport system substrate-binding protein
MVKMFFIPLNATVLLLMLLGVEAGGAGRARGAPPGDDPVSVVSCLDQDLIDFLAGELEAKAPGAAFTRAAEDRLVLDRIRTLQPSELPDILFGVSTIVLAHLADQGFLEPCQPVWGHELPVGLADREYRWFGVFGDPITIAYNHEYFAEDQLLEYLPKGWEALGEPRYRGTLLLEKPDPFNVTGYLFASLVDRADQLFKDQEKGFDLLAGIDRNHLRYYKNREEILRHDVLFSGGDGSITIAMMSAVERCAEAELSVDLVLPVEGLFLYPRGIALVKGASDIAREMYAALVDRERLRRCAESYSCFPLILKETYSFSLWPGERISLEVFPTDHDSVRRNIVTWIGTWQNIYQGRRRRRTDSIHDAVNTTMTFLIPVVILTVILTSRGRRKRRSRRDLGGRDHP